ncbi:MAG: apolipoprotein acyltransferase [Shimia sp.]
MIPFVTMALFGTYGGVLAWRRKGGAADVAQYAVGFAIFGGLVGMLAAIVIGRL